MRWRINDIMNMGQYKDTKDMERVMLTNIHRYSSVCFDCDVDIYVKKRIEKIRKLREKIQRKRKTIFWFSVNSKSLLQKVKDLF